MPQSTQTGIRRVEGRWTDGYGEHANRMTSTEYFLLIAVLGLAGYLWLDGARAREFATALSRESCQRRGFQFLDDSVALTRIAPRWTGAGLRLRRMYTFDFSVEGVGRRTAFIILVGIDLEVLDFGTPEEDSTAAPATAQEDPATKSRRLH